MDMVNIIGTAFVGFVGGIGALWAQHHILWKPQKRIEMRRAVFDEALNALAKYQVDALDVDLQKANVAKEGDRLVVDIRLETRILMQRARLQVAAFFSPEASVIFNEALDATIGIRNVPNTKFIERSAAATKMMAIEIGLLEPLGRWYPALRRWFPVARN